MMDLLRTLFRRNSEAPGDPDLESISEIKASQRARIDILTVRDDFLRDGAAEVRRQKDLRRSFRGEILIDDLFGPNPRGRHS